MDEQTTTQNTDTPQSTNTTPEWKTIAPSFQNETELARGFTETKSALSRAQQELATLKQQQAQPKQEPQTNNVSWDWDDPSKMFDPNQGFTEDFSKYVGDKIPKEVLSEFGDTIKQARQIIANDRAQKWDKVSGVENTQKHVLDYLQKTYQGKELQDRVSDLENPRWWEAALKNTLKEMQDKDYSPDGNEPSPLPDATSTASLGVASLDPNSEECSRLMSDDKYREDAAYQANIHKRIAQWRKSQR